MLNREPFSLLSPSLSASALDRAPLALKPYDASINRHRPSIVVLDPERTNASDERVVSSTCPSRTRTARAHLDTTVITAGTLAGSTFGYSVGVRFRWLGLLFFGRVSR